MSRQVKPLYGTDERRKVVEASKRGIVHLIRVSDENEIGNVGSRLAQRNQRKILERYGINPEVAITIDVCESAKGDEDDDAIPPALEQLLQLIRTGQVGVIVVLMSSRLARNVKNGITLLDAAKSHRVIFLVGGQLFDPRDRYKYDDLVRMIAAARLENVERAVIITQTRDELARDNNFILHLPTGLMWADPREEAYRRLLEEQALGHHVSDEVLERHRVRVERSGRTYFILPDPYPGVYRACELVCQWMLAHRDPAQVLLGIQTDPAYPMPGKLPVTRGFRFPRGEGKLKWKRATTRRLRRWFDSPALFGIYQHTSRALEKYIDVEDPIHRDCNAFPSFLTAADWKVVQGIWAGESHKKWGAGGYKGPKNHALAELVCAHPMGDGKVCGCRLREQYRRRGDYRYQNTSCGFKDHTRSYHASIEDAVLAVLEEAFSPEATLRAVERLRLGADQTRTRRAHLRAEIERIDEELRVANDKELQARRLNDPEQEERWSNIWSALNRQRRDFDSELARLDEAGKRMRKLTEEEFSRIQASASNVSELIRELRAVETAVARRAREDTPFAATGLVRRLVSGLTDFVSVRQLWAGVSEVTVHFTNGARVTRTHITEPPLCSQPERVWIHEALRRGADPETIAAELNAIRGKVTSGRMKGVYPWTADRVRTADMVHREAETVTPRDGRHTSLGALAERVGVDLTAMSRMVLLGKLGPARFRSSGVAVRPTPEELHAAFPEFALRDTARAMRWPERDTVPIYDCAREFGHSPPWVETRAKRGSGIARDQSGRKYVRRSDIADAAEPLEMALEQGPERFRTLDRQWWMSKGELRARYPDLPVRTLNTRVPTVSLNKRNHFHHVPPETAKRLALPSLATAISQTGLQGLHEGDFWTREQVISFLRERFGFGSKTPLETAGKKGRIVQVRARGGSDHQQACWYIYVPEDVRNATDGEVARRWLRGERQQT